jgi:hypothetical protein
MINTKMTTTLINSNHGFQTNVWGPPAWLFLHCITLNYNTKYKKEFYTFFKMLQFILPCKACRDNYSKVIYGTNTNFTLTMDKFKNRKSLSLWLFRIHNYITTCQTNKPLLFENTPEDFNRFVETYSKIRARCSRKKTGKYENGCVNPLKGGIKLRSVIAIKPLRISQKKSIHFPE